MLMITGARGWEHAHWQGNYYPKEIADDWHLTFYAKEFQTALAPVSLWSNYTIEEIKEFCSDVNEKYPLFFEQNTDEADQSLLNKQIEMNGFVANWVVFNEDGWQKNTDHYFIRQAEIIKNSNLEENPGVFCAHSNEIVSDLTLREIMESLKKEFKKFTVIYLFFDGKLTSIDILNKSKTLRRMLNLDFL